MPAKWGLVLALLTGRVVLAHLGEIRYHGPTDLFLTMMDRLMNWAKCLRRATLAKLALAAASTLVTLGLLEVALRVVDWPGEDPVWATCPETAFCFAPNLRYRHMAAEYDVAFETNQQGLRNDEIGPKRGPRILLLGDSYTCGYGVERGEIFADRLREQLGVDLVNAGVGGFEIIHQLHYYRTKGRQLQADLVVFALYLGNDLTNNGLWESLADGSLRRRDGTSPLVNRHTPKLVCLLKRSVLVRRLHHALWDRFKDHRVDTPSREYLSLCTASLDETAKAHYRMAQDLLLQLRDEVTADGARFFVVAIPPRSAVEGPSPEAFLLDGQSGPAYDLLRPTREIGEFLRQHGIDHLLLTDALRDDFHRLETPLYFPFDGHLDALGHRLVAEHVLPVLSARRLGRDQTSRANSVSPVQPSLGRHSPTVSHDSSAVASVM